MLKTVVLSFLLVANTSLKKELSEFMFQFLSVIPKLTSETRKKKYLSSQDGKKKQKKQRNPVFVFSSTAISFIQYNYKMHSEHLAHVTW